MQSRDVSKLNNLQRDLGELEIREESLLKELEAVQAKMRLIKSELVALTENHGVTKEVLERVYEQRRGPADLKKKR